MPKKAKAETRAYRVGYYYDGPGRRYTFSVVVNAESRSDAMRVVEEQMQREGTPDTTVFAAEEF